MEGAPFIGKQWFIHHDVPMDFTITLMGFDRQTLESMHEQFLVEQKKTEDCNKKNDKKKTTWRTAGCTSASNSERYFLSSEKRSALRAKVSTGKWGSRISQWKRFVDGGRDVGLSNISNTS